MVEHPIRRIVLILTLIGLGVVSLIANGVHLGLDLSGGSRLVYRVPIEQAKIRGDIAKDADPSQLMEETLGIIDKRINPTGTLDANLTQAGSDKLLIELPQATPQELAQIMRTIKKLGSLEMRMVVSADYLNGTIFNKMEEEQKRLRDWLAKPENKKEIEEDPLRINKFNQSTEFGPKAPLRWAPVFRKKKPDGTWEYRPSGAEFETEHFVPLNMHERIYFTGEDIISKSIGESTNPKDNTPALTYEIVPQKAGEYADLSTKYIGKRSAILLNGYVRIAPVFQERIPGGRVLVTGGFTKQEVEELVTVLKTGSLKVVPQLESKEVIGATLGQEAIRKGTYSIIAGGIVIFLFMLTYYRQVAGAIACIGLVVNLFMVMGGLALIKATLTLPGLGGVVLTIGMAVDANILIFERIREELDRGKDLKRAVEAGFDRAMSTILDANITTFLTGMILYNVGIGPIRGFAVTLMFGIVTSVFSALYVSKTLFHVVLAREKVATVKMARLFTKPDLGLLRFTKFTIIGSALAIVLGLFAFFEVSPMTKYGLDFIGGAAVKISLRKPSTEGKIKDELAKAGFTNEFPDPEIATLGKSENGKFREFSLKLKLKPSLRAEWQRKKDEAEKLGKDYTPPYKQHLQAALADILTFDAFEKPKAYTPEGTNLGFAGVTIHFASVVERSTLKNDLSKSLNQVKVVGLDEDGKPDDKLTEARSFRVEFQCPPQMTDDGIPAFLGNRFDEIKDKQGKLVRLSTPFPEDSLIGARAVGELTDAAISAIILSLFIIVMYIRVRFHEFKYGIAACLALVHDVAITLGVITALNAAHIIHAEINLPMIAAFLTIIGYSLNDTIVVFDRIRENLEVKKKYGETKIDFVKLVDQSVDQNLSRTVLTSVTTFLVVLCQFVFNHGQGSVLEGFSFAMMTGIVVGTYSSIWIANPLVVWIYHREMKSGRAISGGTPPKLPSKPTKEEAGAAV